MDGIHKGRKRCIGRGEKIMWIALFFLLDFDEVAHDLGYGKGQIKKGQRYITSLRLSFYAENYWKAHSTTPILLGFTLLPTFIGRHAHLEDVATPTRQRRKIFGNRLTSPQLGEKHSKPWRNSVTPPKARHLKPLFLDFYLNRSKWRTPRGNRKSCSSA